MFCISALLGLWLSWEHYSVWICLYMLVLAVLNWTFYPKRFSAFRGVITFSFAGLALAILFLTWLEARAQSVGDWVLCATFGALVLLPSAFNDLFWTLGTLALNPVGWRRPELQKPPEVLAASPYAVCDLGPDFAEQPAIPWWKSTMNQPICRYECRYHGETIKAADSAPEIDIWLLKRYGEYRRLRGLPVDPEIVKIVNDPTASS